MRNFEFTKIQQQAASSPFVRKLMGKCAISPKYLFIFNENEQMS